MLLSRREPQWIGIGIAAFVVVYLVITGVQSKKAYEEEKVLLQELQSISPENILSIKAEEGVATWELAKLDKAGLVVALRTLVPFETSHPLTQIRVGVRATSKSGVLTFELCMARQSTGRVGYIYLYPRSDSKYAGMRSYSSPEFVEWLKKVDLM